MSAITQGGYRPRNPSCNPPEIGDPRRPRYTLNYKEKNGELKKVAPQKRPHPATRYTLKVITNPKGFSGNTQVLKRAEVVSSFCRSLITPLPQSIVPLFPKRIIRKIPKSIFFPIMVSPPFFLRGACPQKHPKTCAILKKK